MNVRVLETNVMHASDIVYWLDGTTGGELGTPAMQRVNEPLIVDLDDRPSDLSVLQKTGQMALWRRPTDSIVAGLADESERTRPAATPYDIAGTVRDLRGNYNPRAFGLTVGDGGGHSVVLYPSPKGTRLPKAGALIGGLRFEATGLPVPWALLEVTVTTSATTTATFRAQADGHGSFVLPLTRLPPLPTGVTEYAADLGVRALSTAEADTPVDPADLVAMDLEALDASAFSSTISFDVTPGEVRLLRSNNKDHLAVQP